MIRKLNGGSGNTRIFFEGWSTPHAEKAHTKKMEIEVNYFQVHMKRKKKKKRMIMERRRTFINAEIGMTQRHNREGVLDVPVWCAQEDRGP